METEGSAELALRPQGLSMWPNLFHQQPTVPAFHWNNVLLLVTKYENSGGSWPQRFFFFQKVKPWRGGGGRILRYILVIKWCKAFWLSKLVTLINSVADTFFVMTKSLTQVFNFTSNKLWPSAFFLVSRMALPLFYLPLTSCGIWFFPAISLHQNFHILLKNFKFRDTCHSYFPLKILHRHNRW